VLVTAGVAVASLQARQVISARPSVAEAGRRRGGTAYSVQSVTSRDSTSTAET